MRRSTANALDVHREVHAAAKSAAEWVQSIAPEICAGSRVEIDELAQHLGIVVRTRADLNGRARWVTRAQYPQRPSLWDDASPLGEIEVRGDLRHSTRRFAIAHEIGHAVLKWRLPKLESRLPTYWRERFASTFAAEILISRQVRPEICRAFGAVADPLGLLRLADSVGVSYQVLLRVAAQDNWLSAIHADRVWLDFAYQPNRVTRRDPRTRVRAVCVDRERWYIPTNRSAEGILGDAKQLPTRSGDVREWTGTIRVSRVSQEAERRFTPEEVSATISAMRLRPSSERGKASTFIVIAHLGSAHTSSRG